MHFFAPTLMLACAVATGMAQAQPARPAKPDEEKVRRDVWGDGAGKIKAELTAGKTGELEWDARTQSWTFQRGFIVTRKGNLAEYPQANLEVGGLAVYRHTGNGWVLEKLLTTFNRYSGIPAPSDEDLIGFAQSNAEKVFRERIRDMPQGIQALKLSQDVPVKWHNAKSLSYFLNASYSFRIPSNGKVVPCASLWEVRIYRDNVQAPWKNPVGMYKKIISGCVG